MTDGTTGQNPVIDATPAAAAPPAADPAPQPDAATTDRNSPAFKAVTKQVAEERAAREALQAQLDEIQNEKKTAKEAAELKALEEAADYKTIMAKKDAQIEALTKAHNRAMVEAKLKVALLGSGAQNDVFMDGAVSRYDGDAANIDKYVADLKAVESNAVFFGVQAEAPAQGLPAADGGTPATSGTVDFRQLKQDLSSGDPVKAAAASAAITKFAEDNNGALPPGF